MQSTTTTNNLLVILLPQLSPKKLGVAAPGSHVGFCAGSVPLPATVNRNTPMRRQGELKLVNGAWTSRDGGTFRKCTDGMGAERPVLYRYRRVLSSQPGRWHTDRVCAADWSSKDKERPHAGVGMASYITPDIGHEPESVEWDVLEGTEEEHQYAQLWLDKLVLLPDELHITERLVEGWRDLADQLAVSNGSRKQGTWLFRHAWAASACCKVFKRNWRTYQTQRLSVVLQLAAVEEIMRELGLAAGRAIDPGDQRAA